MRESLKEYCSHYDRNDLLEQWDFGKNAPLTPDDVSYGSHTKVWWRCPEGHEWQSPPYARTGKTSGCPYCTGKKVLPGLDFQSLSPSGRPICTQSGICLYRTQEGWLRIYTPLTAKDGCQVACFLRFSGKHTLYYPRSKWPLYANPLRCAHLLGGEALLLRHDAFLLHSSVVMHNGRVVLFSGPSGAGKSTQAQLWNRYLDAKIVNGDRCVIRKNGNCFWGGGSIWSGTSGIYQPDYAPIAGIFLVNQSPSNSLEPLRADAFFPLFTRTIINSWDEEFVSKVTELITDLIGQTPIYRLNCRPDEDAVRLVHNAVFQGSMR